MGQDAGSGARRSAEYGAGRGSGKRREGGGGGKKKERAHVECRDGFNLGCGAQRQVILAAHDTDVDDARELARLREGRRASGADGISQ